MSAPARLMPVKLSRTTAASSSHPAADARGYVRTPNVDALVEIMDMREAQRSYEANLKAIQSSRTMLQQTIDILR